MFIALFKVIIQSKSRLPIPEFNVVFENEVHSSLLDWSTVFVYFGADSFKNWALKKIESKKYLYFI